MIRATAFRQASLTVVLGVCTVAHAQESLLRDSSFEAYRLETPGPWEFRYGHKGGNYPKTRPRWKLVWREAPASPDRGSYVQIVKDGAGAGALLVGQRLRLPDPLPQLDLAIEYQSFCAGDNRSGIVTLCLYTPAAWDALERDPEKATAAAERADILSHTVHNQGDDVTEWTLGRVPSSALRARLREYAGQEVVVAVMFLTWHETTEEWARLDTFWLGPPLPHIQALQWPRYVYEGEPIDLAVDAASREPRAHVVLQYRATGAPDWQQVVMQARGDGQYSGTIPAAAVREPLEVMAMVSNEGGKEQKTDVHAMALTWRPEHPNLFYSKTELARMPEKIAAYEWAKAIHEGMQRRADAWLTRAFEPEVVSGAWWHHYGCNACGGRLRMEGPRKHVCATCGKVWDTDILYGVYWSKVHGDHARAARELAMTYQMTSEQKYARRAIEFLTWYADHYAEFPSADKGGKVVSQTLDECVWLLQMMEAADLAYPAMTQEEARHIERDLIYAGAMYTRKYRGGIHNIRCWHNSCWASAGYFLGDPELVTFARDHKYGFVAQMEQGVLDDGMWYERSMGYHSYTVSAILYHLKAAMHAGDELYRMPQVRKLLMFPLLITFPNLVAPSLNDGGFSTQPISPNRLELAVAWYHDPVAVGALKKRYAMGASRSSLEAWQFGEELPESTEFVPAPSTDLKGAGLAVLRRGQGDSASCAMLEYGEHGGGHGHPDKLQLILYGLGRQLCPDLGTTGYANPLHPKYYKTTPAHNTVTLGGRDMASVGGELLAFEANERYSAAVAQSGDVYKGYVLTRRVLLGDAFLVDEFIVAGGELETFDWFLRADGRLSLGIQTAPVEESPLAPAYAYLKNLRGGETDGDWSATWMIGDDNKPESAARLIVTMKGEPGTQVTCSEAPGAARTGELWGTLRVRRMAPGTRFTAVHQMVPPQQTALPVSFDGRTVRIGDAVVELVETLAQAPVLK